MSGNVSIVDMVYEILLGVEENTTLCDGSGPQVRSTGTTLNRKDCGRTGAVWTWESCGGVEAAG